MALYGILRIPSALPFPQHCSSTWLGQVLPTGTSRSLNCWGRPLSKEHIIAKRCQSPFEPSAGHYLLADVKTQYPRSAIRQGMPKPSYTRGGREPDHTAPALPAQRETYPDTRCLWAGPHAQARQCHWPQLFPNLSHTKFSRELLTPQLAGSTLSPKDYGEVWELAFLTNPWRCFMG